MIAPRKYVHLLLMISKLILIGAAVTMIIIYDRTDWDRKIWIGSKILTLENITKIYNKETYPYTSVNTDGENDLIDYYNKSYESLLQHSGSS